MPLPTQLPNGETAMREMAACMQPGLIGCTQVTEINGTPGVELVDLLPAEFELATDYTLGICSGAAFPQQAHELAALLTGPESAELRRKGGFEFLRPSLVGSPRQRGPARAIPVWQPELGWVVCAFRRGGRPP